MDNNFKYSGTTTAPNSYTEQSCSSRLPCGVCMITGNRCPLTWSVQPTWITTVGSTTDAGVGSIG